MENTLINLENSGISVVIGSFNRKKFLKKTIGTVRSDLDSCPFPHEIIVVDGGSTDGTLSWLMNQKDIITIVQHNRGFWDGKPIERRSWGYFMNLGFKSAKGKYICMLSDDCLVIPGAIKNGYSLFETKLRLGEKIGAIAFFWRDWPEGDSFFVGRTLANKMLVNHGMYLTSVIKEINYINEKDFVFYHADADLSLRIWEKGYSVISSPDSFVEHFSHANLSIRVENEKSIEKDWEVLLRKWETKSIDISQKGSRIISNNTPESLIAVECWQYAYKKLVLCNKIKKRYFDIVNLIKWVWQKCYLWISPN